MDRKQNLKSFLYQIKDTLPFEDAKDFQEKIINEKEFRIKIQKLAYLSKFFGWDNDYQFNFHKHGPYSCQLSEDYHGISSFDTSSENYQTDSEFYDFVENQNVEQLESSATILYYLNKLNLNNYDENNLINILSYLKPHIDKQIIENVYVRIAKFGLFDCNIPNNEIKINKAIVLDKLNGLIEIFETFESSSNRTLLLGSLDYFRLALKREKLNEDEEKKLFELVYEYAEYIETYYFTNYSLADELIDSDLRDIDEKFDELQTYISELNILPRLYDEDVDLSVFCK